MTITPLAWVAGFSAIKSAYDKQAKKGKYVVCIGLVAEKCPATRYFNCRKQAIEYAQQLITQSTKSFPTCFLCETGMNGKAQCLTLNNIGEVKCQSQ